jgi:NtrC-family two-component system response regulator AlgB
MNILLVDDDGNLRKSIRLALGAMGHSVFEAPDSARAKEIAEREPIDITLLDLKLGREYGLNLLPELRQLAPGMQIVVITAYATIESAVEAMRGGAFDYLPKPFTPEQLRTIIDRTARLQKLESQVQNLEEQIRAVVPEADLRTQDPGMQQAIDLALKAADSEAAILLRGENGTGKGVLAHAIHARSKRATGPFVTIHCPSLSAELLESELFGHVRGAFTGAVRDTVGKVAAASGGTLFLDEVGDLPLPLQPKLLRLLQDKRYERVGDTQTRVSDVRIVSATNHALEQDTAGGRFREDLLYRLNVIELTLPPLRQRRGDILPLAEHLLHFFAAQAGQSITGFTEEAKQALLRHAWPGNVRELRNAVERGCILTSEPLIGLADLPAPVGAPGAPGIQVGGRVSLEALEGEHIRRVLGMTSTMEEASEVLGIDPSTLYRKRKRYGL